MGNFEKLSVLVIVVIIVMILVVALYQWTGDPGSEATGGTDVATTAEPAIGGGALMLPVITPAPANPGRTEGSGAAANTASVPGERPGPALTLESLIKGAVLTEESASPSVTPAPTVETPKPTEPRTHVVEPGQTLGGIAKVYFPGRVQKGLQAMMAANPSVDATRMRVGTKLTIPDLGEAGATPASTTTTATHTAEKPVTSIERGGWYVTKRGDTLTGISKRAYGTTERWPEIWIENMDALGTDFERPDSGIRIRIPR